MGICHNVQSCAPSLSGDFGAVFNQQSSNSTTLHAGINKQGVQFGFSIRPRLHGCKPHDYPHPFRNEHSTSGDLLRRQFNCIRMSEQSISVTFISKRCTRLQLFKLQLLRSCGNTNGRFVHRMSVHTSILRVPTSPESFVLSACTEAMTQPVCVFPATLRLV